MLKYLSFQFATFHDEFISMDNSTVQSTVTVECLVEEVPTIFVERTDAVDVNTQKEETSNGAPRETKEVIAVNQDVSITVTNYEKGILMAVNLGILSVFAATLIDSLSIELEANYSGNTILLILMKFSKF